MDQKEGGRRRVGLILSKSRETLIYPVAIIRTLDFTPGGMESYHIP